MFVAGWHKSSAGAITRTGTIVVKRGYNILQATSPGIGTLVPVTNPVPVFLQDEAETNASLGKVKYEHDLAAEKSGADVVILPRVSALLEEVQIGSAPMFKRPPFDLTPWVFGWEPRDSSARKADGQFPESASAYPMPEALPAGFSNRYFSGYRRTARALVSPSVPPYLEPATLVRLIRSGAADYGFRLGSEHFRAAYRYYSGIGLDNVTRWQSVDVPMRLDTLVVEPDENWCYAVWRGVWELDERPESDYRQLTVEIEGGE